MISIQVKECAEGISVTIRAPKREDFDAALWEFKNQVPPPCARFDSGRKAWIVDPEYRHALDEFLMLMGCRDAQVHYADKTKDKPVRLTVESACQTLHLLPFAPAVVVKAAYRALAQIHHPDAGGNEDEMKRLNAAYDLVTRELAA
jgi:hypothetical protein